ncbi:MULTISPECIES: peptidoglycan DD-metalloendopeptidase family protein [unclassified Flavobacterium]|jgi:murein DD-endopeptidase MepM/ murein hydrolase activator NlpD|uniref:peptidoglycan DD-metalloendopeptidase family protein n=1 Tax=unclassified Flavobacterium TaxID=196869 RepID=UPI0025C0C6C5|nr:MULTISPECIES: peptidoglycan DD-metalloendopeptidase family protein [unclassified Flavobacterium]
MSNSKNIFLQLKNVKVIDSSIPYSQYIPLDLSIANTELSEMDLGNAKIFEAYVEDHLQKNDAKVAFGGYNEERNLYKRSGLFNVAENEERNIHLGIDFWIKAGTKVLVALDGRVHSFDFNAGLGNYGSTIILEHQLENEIFYTLYGHLSMESIENIEIDSVYKKGQTLATLGDASVNGGYSPHLHFQIIKNMEDNFGDYPGVCSKKTLDYYLDNCPDPHLLLKIT